MDNIIDLLARRHVFFDGAMGTELQKRGLRDDPAVLNLTADADIIGIHREYILAGADIITANTFGAYSHKYKNAAEIIKAAISHGRTALESQANKWLALDLGPTGLMLAPYGDTTCEECFRIFAEAVQAGADSGADLILIETMMDLAEMELAVKAAHKTGLPVFATMSFDKNGKTMMGAAVDDMIELLEGLDVDAIGMNCGFGSDVYVPLAADLSGKTKLPVMVQPNAGIPLSTLDAAAGGEAKGQFITAQYNLTIDDFAETMASMDAKILGGCCGTSPAHIAALVRRLS